MNKNNIGSVVIIKNNKDRDLLTTSLSEVSKFMSLFVHYIT